MPTLKLFICFCGFLGSDKESSEEEEDDESRLLDGNQVAPGKTVNELLEQAKLQVCIINEDT